LAGRLTSLGGSAKPDASRDQSIQPDAREPGKFARETSETVGIDIVPVDSYQEGGSGVDIIITATTHARRFG